MTASSRCRWSPERSSPSSPPRSRATPSAARPATPAPTAAPSRVSPALVQYTYGTPDVLPARALRLPALLPGRRHPGARGQRGRGKAATTSVGGAQVPVDGPALMVFEQSAAAGPWQLASVAQFPSGTTLPRLSTDKNGYIPQVPLTSTDLLAQPYATGPLQAAVVDDGPGQRRGQGGGGGPADHRPVPGSARPRRQSTSRSRPATSTSGRWRARPYPAFALRTADGGALVLYAMYLNSTVAVPGYFNDASPIQPGAPDQDPAGPAPPPPVRPAQPPGKARGPVPLLLRRHRPPGHLVQDHGPSHRRRPQLRHRLLTRTPL